MSFLLRGACVLHLRSVFRSIDCLPGRAGRAPLFSKSYAYTLLFFRTRNALLVVLFLGSSVKPHGLGMVLYHLLSFIITILIGEVQTHELIGVLVVAISGTQS